MSSVVLALLSRTELAPAILAGADRLSVLLNGAQIEATALRIDPLSPALQVKPMKIPYGADQEIAVRHVFDIWAAKHAGADRPRWIQEEGVTESLIKTWGERGDYIVIGRLDAYAGHAVHDAMRGALHASLFSSRRPILMMPPQAKPEFGKTIAVAWRDDEFSLRALLAALQLIPNPEGMHVLIGRRPENPPAKLPEVLASHNVHASLHELSIDSSRFGAKLLAAAHHAGADLLVMGAFVHNPWHNLLFGGVTDYILAHGDIPVLMMH